MTKEAIQKEIEQARKALAGAEKMGIEKFVTKAKEKIAKLESELSELETSKTDEKKVEFEYDKMAKRGDKSKATKKGKGKTKAPAMGKSVKEIIKAEKGVTSGAKKVTSGKVGSYSFDEKNRADAPYNSKIIKVSETHYTVLYNSDTDKDAEIKLVDGKWEIICCELKEYPEFKEDRLFDAIKFILDFKDCLYSRLAKVNRKKSAKKYKAKMANVTEPEKVENAVEKAAESVELHVEKVIDKGKTITEPVQKEIVADVKSIVKAVKDGIKDKTDRVKFIEKLIAELKKLI